MSRHIQLEDLESMAPAIDSVWAAFLKANCIVSLVSHSHASDVSMWTVFPDEEGPIAIRWENTLPPEAMRKYRDKNKRTDFAACAIALLVMPEMTGYKAIEQSATGDRIDYYLSRDGTDPDLIFNDTALMEVSGIHNETLLNTVTRRIGVKRKRYQTPIKGKLFSTSDLPAYICVVEFSAPKAKAVLA